MGWESFGVVRFDLGPLLQGQTRIAKLKSAYNLLIISPRALRWYTNIRKACAGNLMVWSHLTLGPPLQGQTSIAKLKSAYNSLIIGPRGLGWYTNM